MLERYSAANFKSFKTRTEFDFTATDYPALQETNTANGVLKGGLFVGGNASGKTNAVEAIQFLLETLCSSDKMDRSQLFCLFSKSVVMDFDYRFRIDEHSIRYRLCYQKRKDNFIEELWLDDEMMLERDGPDAESKLSDRKIFDQIPTDSVFLRDIWFNTGFRGHEVLQKWFTFLRNSVYIDLFLQRIRVYNNETPVDINEYLSKNGVETLNRFLSNCGFSYHFRYDPAQAKLNAGSDSSGLYLVRDEIRMNKGIPMQYESLGNIVLTNLLPSYLRVIERGGMLIMDEFSSGLHNDLERLLIQYFMERSGEAQIFLVSHSTNLLSSGLFRPDQLYAVNFDENGSNVVRFSERKPRVSQNLEKMYLAGMFSGMPHYRDASEWGRNDDVSE